MGANVDNKEVRHSTLVQRVKKTSMVDNIITATILVDNPDKQEKVQSHFPPTPLSGAFSYPTPPLGLSHVPPSVEASWFALGMVFLPRLL